MSKLGRIIATIEYTYVDSNWKDKMTVYNGTGISYDVIGNPVYDGTWTYTWEKGRQLKQMSKSGTTATFLYNADGLHIRKTVGSTVTNYTLHGKNIVHLTQGSNNLHFFYDAQNRPTVVNFNSTKYGYIVNLQGNVLRPIDSTGAEAVKYTYDAWGKVLSTTGSLASTLDTIQPFRYRGYIYDVETGLYYLRSRYYYPEWGRFINADALIKGNLYVYCSDSPIIKVDHLGFHDDYNRIDSLGGGGSYSPWLIPLIASILGFNNLKEIKNHVYEQDKSVLQQQSRKNNGSVYTVYFLEDINHTIQYVGRVKTEFFQTRMQHHKSTRHLTPKYYVDNLTYEEARGLEEIGMIECHTLKKTFPWNIIHGIADNNPNLDLYYFDAVSYLDNRAEDFLHNLLEGGI